MCVANEENENVFCEVEASWMLGFIIESRKINFKLKSKHLLRLLKTVPVCLERLEMYILYHPSHDRCVV
jgi:hypothetical protein